MMAPLLIFQITDLHIFAEPGKTMAGVNTEHYFHQVLKCANEKHGRADLTLVTGDLAQEPCQQSYQRIYAELEKYKTRTICLPGNHDDMKEMQKVINGNLINCNKLIQFKYWQIISLNSKKSGSEGGYLASEELDFLTDTLKNSPDLSTVIAVHHHPLPTNSMWMDTMMIENSDELFLILKQYPHVKVITCGHIHQQLEINKDNKLILGTPSTCFQFKPLCLDYTIDEMEPAYRTMELYPDGRFRTKLYRVPIEIIDAVKFK